MFNTRIQAFVLIGFQIFGFERFYWSLIWKKPTFDMFDINSNFIKSYAFSKTSFIRKLACLLSTHLTAILSIKGPRAYHGTATIGHAIYVIGGFDGVEYFNSVRCFNPIYKEWSEVAPMNAKRYLYIT